MSGLVDLCDLSFDNGFVRELPARPGAAQRAAPGARRLLHARRSDAGRIADIAGLVRFGGPNAGRVAPAIVHRPCRRGARRQSRAARDAAVRGALRRASVRPLGGAARRWPRHHARRSRGPGRGAPRPAAQGGGTNAVFAHRRRPRGAALLGARVHVQRGHASPRRADHAGAEPRVHRGPGGARHVLRRPSESRAGRHRLSRRAVVRALRQFRDSRRPSGAAMRSSGWPTT